DYASGFFGDPDLDQKIVSDKEIRQLIRDIKPQPTTQIRESIVLNGWKSYGYKEGQTALKEEALQNWESYPGAIINDGALALTDTKFEKPITPLTWRFKWEGQIRVADNSRFTLELKDGEKTAITLVLGNGTQDRKIKEKEFLEIQNNEPVKLLIEGDLTQKRFNLYLDDQLVHDFIAMADTSVKDVSTLTMESSGNVFLDDFFLFSHTREESANYPYSSSVVLDENFEAKPGIEGWQKSDFDDSQWVATDLPAVHG